MKHYVKKLSLLLAALLVATSLVACAESGEDTKNPADESTLSTKAEGEFGDETEEETSAAGQALSELRERNIDWGKKDFTILYVNDIAGYGEEVEAVEKLEGDSGAGSAVINDAVYIRNRLLEEYCNLKFKLIPTPNSAVLGAVQGEVMSGNGDFQLISQTTSATANAATSGLLYDYMSFEGIDYEQEWWDEGTLNFALNGKVYFMNGSFNIVDDDVTFVMMFNKELRENHHVENPYQTVKNNEWTLDYFNSVISQLSRSDGNDTWDEKDTYGFATPGSIGNTIFYGAGLRYIENNRESDSPTLLLTETKMERALNVLTVARSIVHDNHSTYVAAQGDEALSKSIFMEGRSLFYSEAVSYLRALNAEMDTEYGVLPIPKYSTDQENYTTWSHDIGSTLSIPTSVVKGNLEQFANVLEAYAVLSQLHVRPAYHDNLLTVRNVRDAESSEMVEIIFQNRIYDMAMYYTSFGFKNLFANSVTASDTFSSSYSAASTTFTRRLDRLLSKLKD